MCLCAAATCARAVAAADEDGLDFYGFLHNYVLYGVATCARTVANVAAAVAAAAAMQSIYLRTSGVFFDRWFDHWFDRAMMTLVGEGRQERRSLGEGLTTS